jgi:PAS domain S-box-containing protein
MEKVEPEQQTAFAGQRAEEQILRQYSVLGAINRVYAVALTGATDQMVAHTCLAVAEELTGSKFVFVCQLNQAGGFDITAMDDRGLDEPFMQKIRSALMLPGREAPGILGKVLGDQRSMIINQPASDSDWAGMPESHPPINCFMGIPLKNEGRTVGMIGLANKESAYTAEDQQEIETLSDNFVDALNRKREQEELHRVNRALRTLRECNQALVHITGEALLLREICEIIVEVGGYLMAWVGFVEGDGERILRRVAEAEVAEGYPEMLDMTSPDSGPGGGVIGRAIRSGQFVICNHILTNPDFTQWREEAAKDGYASAIALPLIAQGRTMGALSIYAEDPDAFRSEEANVLMEIASELAHRILTLRAEAERRYTEEALEKSEARYRAVVEQSPDGIYIVDVDSKRILEANPTFAQMLGYPQEEVRGLPIHKIVAANRENIDRRFQEVLGKMDPVFFERQYRRKDGSLVDVWISAKIIAYGGKKVMCGIVRDLTEKKSLEAQFIHAQRMESIGLLAGGIAHDLNNILTPILMNVELLQRLPLDSSSQKMLSSIASNAQRGADIVKQVLAFSRGMEGERLVVFPKYLLKEMEQFAKETFPKSIRIQREIPKDLWPLTGDATQLHQVLLNLCVNAKDAMPGGGTLSLSAGNVVLSEAYTLLHPEAEVGPYVALSVTDTGKGISGEILPKIFDPFFTTKERGQGTGLGLSTVLAIVKSHGGFIEVDSEVGKGSRFTVYLPASPTAEMKKAEDESLPEPSGRGELLLVVEDESSVREIIQTTLEAYGYRVITASDGSEALALYTQHLDEIQAVITDLAMPILDGSATIQALKKLNSQVKVIAISGLEANGAVTEVGSTAVRAFLQKPFTVERLLKTVEEVLRGEPK